MPTGKPPDMASKRPRFPFQPDLFGFIAGALSGEKKKTGNLLF